MSGNSARDMAWTVDRIAIQDAISAIPFHTDLKEYEAVYAFYTDDAVMDYISLLGEEEGLLPVRALRERFMDYLTGFDATQHQITNFQIEIDGDEASSRSHVRATHRVGQDLWTVGGVYHHRLRRTPGGWKVCYHRFEKTYEIGADLVDKARAVVEAQRAALTPA